MLLSIITNRYILTVLCALLVFGEMFVYKKTKLWYGRFTAKIKNVEWKTAINLVLGIFACLVLSASQMFAFCDILPGAVFAWTWVIASAFIATSLYLAVEKIFGNAVTNKLGNVFADFISHNNLFDGNITKDGMIALAEQLLERVNKVDKAKAEKEQTVLNDVYKRFDGFLEDGEITAEEKAVAADLIKTHNIDVTDSTFEQKYKALLGK